MKWVHQCEGDVVKRKTLEKTQEYWLIMYVLYASQVQPYVSSVHSHACYVYASQVQPYVSSVHSHACYVYASQVQPYVSSVHSHACYVYATQVQPCFFST